MGQAGPGRTNILSSCLAAISRERLATALVELIEIPSVNPFDAEPVDGMREDRVAGYLGDRLTRLGWHTEITEFAPGRHNVVARLRGAEGTQPRPSLMLAGHTDTVETTGYPEALRGQVRDGRVYGRGACDMKAALACYLEVAEVLARYEVSLTGDLLVAGVADEEYRQRGAKAFGATGTRVDGVIIGEPTELTVCAAAKGLAAFDLRVHGAATHGSVPHAGSNAIATAAELIRAFDRYERQLDERCHPLLGPPTVNVGVVTGGVKPNIVPSSCRVGFSRRLLPGETPDAVRAEVTTALDGAVPDGLWEVDDAWWTVLPYELPDGHRLGATVRRAAAASGVADSAPRGFPASSDAAYFGSPVVIFGPGSLAQAHSLDEWVAVDDMVTATAVYLRAVFDHLDAPRSS
jgi:acetylornithine deacetylase/succinyl-diaminopimelate desuccinylase family protein